MRRAVVSLPRRVLSASSVLRPTVFAAKRGLAVKHITSEKELEETIEKNKVRSCALVRSCWARELRFGRGKLLCAELPPAAAAARSCVLGAPLAHSRSAPCCRAS